MKEIAYCGKCKYFDGDNDYCWLIDNPKDYFDDVCGLSEEKY